ncbi:MAG: PilZ domain-containing protein [Candidatus Omnitrophica bacterium]|nr:PilZ domain-containing protein [Candidatus Omnitrophota bacterium]
MVFPYKGPERRESERLEVHFILVYEVHKPLEVRMFIGKREVDALMLDLSEGGMAILTNYDIPIETFLSIKFTLINPNEIDDKRVTLIEIMGQVRYNVLSDKDEYRLGICFTNIDEQSKKAIAGFIRMSFG